jgi:hypothetical protein
MLAWPVGSKEQVASDRRSGAGNEARTSSGNGRSEGVPSLRMGGFGASLAPSDWHLACMVTSKHYSPFGGSTGEGRPS